MECAHMARRYVIMFEHVGLLPLESLLTITSIKDRSGKKTIKQLSVLIYMIMTQTGRLTSKLSWLRNI